MRTHARRVSQTIVAAALVAGCGAPATAMRPASLFAPSGPADPAAVQALCPLAAVTMGQGQMRVTLGGDVLFDTDKAILKPGALEVLARTKATVIDAHPEASIMVEGHTDDRASNEHNQALSDRRATSVASWLRQNGVADARISQQGYGEDFPRVRNDSNANRQLNRRVELVISWGSGGATTTAQACPGVQACCELATLAGKAAPEPGCLGKESGWGTELAARELEDSEGVLRLNPCLATRSAAVWITSTGENKIARLDESDGKELFRVPTYGDFPQRTAVAADGSVWVTNRDSGSYVHIASDGKLLCSSPLGTCTTRAAAVDSRGFAWIGCHDKSVLLQVSPTEIDGTVKVASGEVPKCKEVGSVPVPGVSPYGLAADRSGGVWVGVSGGGPVAKVDTIQRRVMLTVDPSEDPILTERGDGCWSPYGITIDRDGNPWYANRGCGNVVKLDGRTGRVAGVFKGGPKGLSSPRALGFDREGHLWVSENGSVFVDELDIDGTFMRTVDISSCGGAAPLGTAADSQGNMWTAIQDAGRVVKYNTEGKILGCYPEAPTPPFNNAYTYSDFTGAAMEMAGSDRGVARVRFDLGRIVRWRLATLTALTPPGTSLCIRARSAITADRLNAATWSAATCPKMPTRGTVNVSLDGEHGPTRTADGAVLELEFSLSSPHPGASPLLSGLSVAATPTSR